MTARSPQPDQDGPEISPAPGALGPPAAPAAGRAGSGERPKAALRRWRQQRQLRHADALERKIRARENLRDYKQFTGDEPGPPLGGF
jgi:hypothetical protein